MATTLTARIADLQTRTQEQAALKQRALAAADQATVQIIGLQAQMALLQELIADEPVTAEANTDG